MCLIAIGVFQCSILHSLYQIMCFITIGVTIHCCSQFWYNILRCSADKQYFKVFLAHIPYLLCVYSCRPCGSLPWELRFTAALSSDIIYSDVLPTNRISTSNLTSQLSANTSTQYRVAQTDVINTVDVTTLFKLSFTVQPLQSRLTDFENYVRIIYSNGKFLDRVQQKINWLVFLV